METKVSKILKAKTEMKTSTGSSFYKVEFQDGSSFSFFHATDVEKLSAIAPGTEINFNAYKKGTWDNGKDINTDPIKETSTNGKETLKELLKDLTKAVYALIWELKQ